MKKTILVGLMAIFISTTAVGATSSASAASEASASSNSSEANASSDVNGAPTYGSQAWTDQTIPWNGATIPELECTLTDLTLNFELRNQWPTIPVSGKIITDCGRDSAKFGVTGSGWAEQIETRGKPEYNYIVDIMYGANTWRVELDADGSAEITGTHNGTLED